MKQKPDFFTLQLKSGRSTKLTAQPYFQAIVQGSEDAQFFAISALRMNAARPETLRQHLVVDQNAGTASVCVEDVLEGRADWSREDVEELAEVLKANPEFTAWLEATFADLDAGIRNSPVFESNLVQNDFNLNRPNPDMFLRALVLKAALKPDAMPILRRKFSGGPSSLEPAS